MVFSGQGIDESFWDGERLLLNIYLALILLGKVSKSFWNLQFTVYCKLHADSCHKKLSVKGIQKNVALRLRRICSSDNEYIIKSKEYTKNLVNREHDFKSVQQCFNNVGKISRQEAWKKVKPRNVKKLIVFSTSFNSHRPRVDKIISRNIYLLLNNEDLKEQY